MILSSADLFRRVVVASAFIASLYPYFLQEHAASAMQFFFKAAAVV
jgi:hypothetical protein